jgi:hypothetical protein
MSPDVQLLELFRGLGQLIKLVWRERLKSPNDALKLFRPHAQTP